MPHRLLPRTSVPPLSVPTLSGTPMTLEPGRARQFSLIVFYRGLHCPLCRSYLTELNRLNGAFVERGVEVLALSSDTQARAAQAQRDWSLNALNLGYGLDMNQARDWGLYVSAGRGLTSIGIEEPAEFSEPGIFLVRPDLTLYWSSIQTMPFARPHFQDMLGAIDFVVAKNYPARGEL